jgi:hypothetical protein
MGTSHGEALAVLQYAEFIQELREEGFTVGIGHYLRAQRLLEAAGTTEPGAVETLLCPIFATNADQQLRFHTLFQRAFPAGYEELEPAPDDTGGRRRPSLATRVLTGEHPTVRRLFPSEWRIAAALFVVLGIGAVAGYKVLHRNGTTPIPADSVLSSPSPSPSNESGASGPDEDDTTVAELAVIAPPAVSIKAPEPAPEPDNTRRMWLTLIPFLLLACVELWRRYRARAVAERQAGVKPPYTWPVRVESAATALFITPEFLQASRTVRRRQRSPDLRFAVRPSIQATIEARGFPTFRFEQGTRPPEYLTLIERAGPSDHQARHFDALARALAVEGAFVSRYFYEHDPRVCFAEEAMSGIRLAELHRRLPSDRVLVFGTGTGFLDPIYGRPLPWLSLLQDWDELALLTPVPPARWGAREVALAGEMLVLPATLEGLRAAIDHFDAGSEPDLRAWHERDRNPIRVEDYDEVTPNELRRALGDDLFRWVAACAVYPELLWDLTLFLGSRDEVGRDLVTERNVLTIARLSWFRRGAFPEPLRLGLLQQLEAMDRPLGRSTERVVRELLEKILEGEALDPQSMAGRAHRRELLHQRLYLYREDPARFHQALRDLQREATADELVQDVTVMRLLRSAPSSPLSLALPKVVRDRFFPGGMPELGLTRLARTGLACAAAAAIWFATKPAPKPVPPPPPPGGRLVPSAVALSVPRGFRFQLGVTDTAGRSVNQGVTWTSTADSVVGAAGEAGSSAGEVDFTGRGPGTATIRAAMETTAVDVAVNVDSAATSPAGVLGPPRVLFLGQRGRITWPTFDLEGTPSTASSASDGAVLRPSRVLGVGQPGQVAWPVVNVAQQAPSRRRRTPIVDPTYTESCDSSIVRVEPGSNVLRGVRTGSAIVINHHSTYDYATVVWVRDTSNPYRASGVSARRLDANRITMILPMHELAASLRADSAGRLDLSVVIGTATPADTALARAIRSALNDSVAGAATRVRSTTRREPGNCDLNAFGWALTDGWLDRVDWQPLPRAIAPNEGWVYLGDYDAKQWRSRYFDFPASATPAAVAGRTLRLSGTAPAMNVRDSPESFPGTGTGRDVLRTGDSVRVLEVRPWGATTFQWGRVRYWHVARSALPKGKVSRPTPRGVTRPRIDFRPARTDSSRSQAADAPTQTKGETARPNQLLGYVPLPSVIGLTLQEALRILAAGKFGVRVDTVVTKDTIETVVAQSPAAGSSVAPRSVVSLRLGRPAGGALLQPAGSESDSVFVRQTLDALLGKYSPDQYQEALEYLAQGRSRADLISDAAGNSYASPGDQGFLIRLWHVVKCEQPSASELVNLSILARKAGNRTDLVRRVLEDPNVRSSWSRCVGGEPYRPPAMAK